VGSWPNKATKLIPANLALSLQQTSGESLGRTARIGLLDLDIFGPSVPKLMGLEGHEPDMSKGKLDRVEMDLANISENRLIPLQNHGVKTMSIGYLLRMSNRNTRGTS